MRERSKALGDYYAKAAIPKPEPRKRAKGRERRTESTVMKAAREEAVARDGYCRLAVLGLQARETVRAIFGACRGPSELAHYNATHRRSKTRGLPAEERHTAAHALMMCGWHHAGYDLNVITIEELTPAGCHGRLRFTRTLDGVEQSWEEPE